MNLDLHPLISIRSTAEPPTCTAQQKGAFVLHGRVRFFTKKKVREAVNTWWNIVSPFVPEAPLDGPLWLRAWLAWPYTTSVKASIRKAGATVPISTRPDIDNIVKSMLDVLTRTQIIADDARIAYLSVAKVRAPHAGVSIDIGKMPEVIN